MQNSQVVDIGVLRRRMDSFLADVERRSPVVEVHSDYYWSVPVDSAFDVYQRPEILTIGQTSEAWANVDRDGELVDYAAIWFADVLRVIGHELISTGRPDQPAPHPSLRVDQDRTRPDTRGPHSVARDHPAVDDGDRGEKATEA